jgi:signal transduction histidine kinase
MTEINMLHKIKKWFQPPAFPDDEDKTRIAGMLHIILLVFLGAIIGALLLATIGRVSITNRAFFNLSLVVAPGSIITMLALLNKGYVRFVAWALVSFQWFSTVTQVLGSGGIASPAISAFVATLLLAGFLISGRAIAIFAVLSVLAILRVWQLENLGQLPPPLVFGSPQAKVFFIMTLMAVIAALLMMVMRALNNSLNRSRVYAKELEQVVREKTQAEEKINKLNEELQLQVAELERFTYTVSHDLRSPIVTIKGFLGMLTQDIKNNRSDRIQSDVRRIEGAAEKMDDLLTDLLELSRIGRIINPPMEIDTVRLIQDALDNLDGRLRPKNIRMQVAPEFPSLYGDRTRLREVFENLIENAAKYIGTQSDPFIEIGTRQDKNAAIIFVKDNGIGIEERYHTRIFALFERLNPKSEGSGIGLALVKRIIETHGGKIWVESDGVGKGSTFCFTIPNKAPQVS